MSDTDARIGKRLQELRRDTSQANLAAAMAERGHKWSQATVWSVETGKRPLRLTEANDVAGVLGITVQDLLAQDRVEQALTAFMQTAKQRTELLRDLAAVSDELDEASERLHVARVLLSRALDDNPNHPQRTWIEEHLGLDGEQDDTPAWSLLRGWMTERAEDEAFLAAEKLERDRGVDN